MSTRKPKAFARCRAEGHDWKPKPDEDNVEVCLVCSSERVDTGERWIYRYPAGYSPTPGAVGRPPIAAPRSTPLRSLRIDDELWADAQELAAEQGMSVSEVIRELLDAWVRDR